MHFVIGTTLSKGCSHIKVCQISLISPFYCKGFGEEMGVGERAEFFAATQYSQNRQCAPKLGIVLIYIIFLSFYSLESGFILVGYPHSMYLLLFIPILYQEISSFNVKRWIKFVARSWKRLFWGHLTELLATQHIMHLNS